MNAFLKENKFKSYTVYKAKSESFCLVPLFPESLRSHRKCCSELYPGTGSLGAWCGLKWGLVPLCLCKAGQRRCRSSSGYGKSLEVLGWFKMCTRGVWYNIFEDYICILCISMYSQAFLLNNTTDHILL